MLNCYICGKNLELKILGPEYSDLAEVTCVFNNKKVTYSTCQKCANNVDEFVLKSRTDNNDTIIRRTISGI